MGIEVGTRNRNNTLNAVNPTGGSNTRTLSTDPGLKSFALNITATFGSGTISASSGQLAGFSVGQQVIVQGTNLNNGYFTVTSTDGSTYLGLEPPPKAEGPLAGVDVRTS